MPTIMPFCARLTIALLATVAVCAAMGQDPYAPPARGPLPQYGQQPQYVPPPSQYPAPPQQPRPAAPNQALRYPLPSTAGPIAAPPVQSPAPSAVQPANNLIAVAPTVPVASEAVLFKPGEIVARVGDKSILYADIAPTVEMRLQGILAKGKTPAERQQLEAMYREPLTKNVIQQAVTNKLLLMEFERGIPAEMRSDPKKKKEMDGKLRKQIRTGFEGMLTALREKVETASPEEVEELMKQDSTMVRLALLMKERHLDSYGELDQVLKEYGTSLEQQVLDYGEYMMGREAARSKINGDEGHKGKGGKGPAAKKEVTYDDLLEYYQAHQADYYIPAKARFEILTAKFSRCGGDRQQTWALIAQMGNEVLLGGTPFPAVARKSSHEPHAQDGGLYDWVTPGSLASKPIDKAVFSLEVDKLSQIIEDDQGYHIIHVLERKEAGQISFQEAQPKIREKIEAQRRAEIQQKYFAGVQAKAKIWTIYDPPEGAEQAAGTPPASPSAGTR